jgi:type VI secretion system protein ImpB
MAKDGSVAPRERINIKYRPATGDASEEKELPLKLLMLGDYSLRNDETPLEERKPVQVDKDNFNDVMRGMNLQVDVGVKDTLSGKDDEEMAASLKFESLKDFGPESIASQVPELSQLLALREALEALKGPLGNMQGFRKKIQELLKDENSRDKLLAELGVGKPGGGSGSGGASGETTGDGN